jgi:hypothetical protein
MVVSMVKPKSILQVCSRCFFSALNMTLECRGTKLWTPHEPRMEGYQTLAGFWVHDNFSTLKDRAKKMPIPIPNCTNISTSSSKNKQKIAKPNLN